VRRPLRGLLGLLGFVEPGHEQAAGAFAVLLLALGLHHLDDDAGGLVVDLPGGLDLVDVLTAGPWARVANSSTSLTQSILTSTSSGSARAATGGGGGVDAALGLGGRDAFHEWTPASKESSDQTPSPRMLTTAERMPPASDSGTRSRRSNDQPFFAAYLE
jgi:hypothetical protein